MAEERAQRRLAGILAADVVGYSRLMGVSEAGTLAALKAHRRELFDGRIAEHQGRIVKLTGDGMLAEFPSVVNAVACAVEIQRKMVERNSHVPQDQRIEFRIGVHLGDIIVEDNDIFGDGVNVAARLEALAEPGGICISDDAHRQIRGKLDFGFEDAGEQQLKNIARPLRIFHVRPGISAHAPQATLPGLPDMASVAVLPFTNLSSDAEQEFFADGLSEDLITDLSKVPGLLVIARNSSFAYRGRSVDIRSIARELGVRYVIEGSVRRASTRVRINAQLIDAAHGSHIWADRFDRDLSDIFLVQDEVVGKIVSALAGTLPSARTPPKRRATSLEVYDLFVRGRSMVMQSPQETVAGRPLLIRAIELDPGFAEAHAWLALSHHFSWMHWGEDLEEHRMLARSAARDAISLDPNSADAHIVLGYLSAHEGDLAGGVAELELGLRINPNNAEGWTMLADLRVFEHRSADAIDHIGNALRLDPHPRGDYYWLLAWTQYAAGRYQDAVETLRHEGAATVARRILAAALAQLGRMQEAREEASKFLLEFPHFSARQWGRTQPFQYDADRQHFIDGYLKAGLPE